MVTIWKRLPCPETDVADRRVMTDLSHIDEKGKARMVDVSGKAETRQ